MRIHAAEFLAAKDDLALLRVVDPVEHIEHRALARAVRADDGADLVLLHVEGDLLQGLNAAESERDVFDAEDHAARSAAAGANVLALSILKSAENVPLRPSSYFTCASTCTASRPA